MKKSILIIFMIIASFFFKPIYAEENGIKFNVEAVLPENQVDKQASYFHLDTSKGLDQDLLINLYNLSKEEILIETKLLQAITNTNGQIEYVQDSKSKNYFNLEHEINKFVEIKNPIIKIPALSSVTTKIHIKVDENLIKGLTLGALNFSINENDNTNATIVSSYEYNIALALSDNNKPLKSSKTLGYDGASLGLENYRKAIFVKLINEEAAILSDLKLNIRITDSKGQEIVSEMKDLELAPNTIFNAPTALGKSDIAPGTYKVKIIADSYKQHWEWDDELIVGGSEAKKVNVQDVDRVELPDFVNYLFFVLTILSGISILLNIKKIRKEGI